ncbi:MAG: response regulator, partial [Eubacteriales bacterium]|nr:response regulator [Eubacteriales bacterium]
SIPILAVSANAFPEDIEKSLQSGMNEHLSKPIHVKSLFEMMEELAHKPEIRHVLYKPIFQSVLFNAIMEDFGEYRTNEDAIPDADFHGIHAMIVEDNKVNSDILSRILKRANVRTTLCENGQEAVEAFLSSAPGTYQLILMDIQMPVMNGYEAAAAIRGSAHAQAGSIPILAVSANAFPEDIEKSLQSGMNEHLSKPIHVKSLFEMMETYLSASGRADAEASRS